MGEVVQLKSVGGAAVNAERELIEAFAAYAHGCWHPITGLKRGCAQAVARVAYRESDGGTNWLKVNPADLLVAALPSTWDERTIDLSTSMTILFWDFLLSCGALGSADVAFLEGWTHGGQACLYRALLRQRTDAESLGVYARMSTSPGKRLQQLNERRDTINAHKTDPDAPKK